MSKNVIFMDAWALNGALVDAIEYYLYARHVKKDIELIFFENKRFFDIRKTIADIIEDRYVLDFDYREGISYRTSKTAHLKENFDNILIFDYTTLDYVPTMRGVKTHIFYDHEPSRSKIYNLLIEQPNVKVYNEMPFGLGERYTMKFAFDLYRPLNNYGLEDFVDKKDNRVIKGHKKNMFDFEKYVYLHDGTFDRRPRMMIESYFYGKEIVYLNDKGVQDGSWYRYRDLMENGIKYRYLSKDDEVLSQL